MGIPVRSASTMSLPGGGGAAVRAGSRAARQAGPSLHAGLPPRTGSPLRLGLPVSLSLPRHTEPHFTWAPSFRLGVPPQTGPTCSDWTVGGTGPLPSGQASPECRMTVTDTYKDLPTRASSREGCTPSRSTSRLSVASPVPSSNWGRKRRVSARGRGSGGEGTQRGRRRASERRRLSEASGKYHNAGEGLGQRNPLVTILDPKDDKGCSFHILPVQEPVW